MTIRNQNQGLSTIKIKVSFDVESLFINVPIEGAEQAA